MTFLGERCHFCEVAGWLLVGGSFATGDVLAGKALVEQMWRAL
jgi:hypothetical protein